MEIFSVTKALISLLIALFPFCIASFFYFRKNLIIERLLIGFFCSYVFISLFGFLLLFFGINFNEQIAYFTIILSYVISLAISYNEYKKHKFSINELFNIDNEIENLFSSIMLIVVLYIAFVTRLTTLNPIYYELDPYFYLYVTVQILTLGNLPLNDQTAWWPVVESNHRTIPGLGFYQAVFYVLNEGTKSVDIYKLSFYANFYPVIVSIFMAFFVYLAFKQRFSPLAGILASLLFITTPAILAKTQSGLFEAQPNGFMFHVVVLSLIYLSIKDRSYLPLLIVSFAAYMPLANTQVQVSFFYMLLLTLFLLLEKNVKDFIPVYAFYIIFNLLFILFSPFSFSIKSILIYIIAPLFLCLFLLFKEKVMLLLKDQKRANIIKYSIFLISLVVLYALFILSRDLFVGIATYEVPLVRTIAEQNPTGQTLQPLLGFVGIEFDQNLWFISIIAEIVEKIFSSIYQLLQVISGYVIIYVDKNPSFLFILMLFSSYLFIKNVLDFYYKRAELDILLFLTYVFFMPLAFLGLLKAKFAIQLALGAGILGSYIVAFLIDFIKSALANFKLFDNEIKKVLYTISFFTLFFFILEVNIGIGYIKFASSEKPGFNNLYSNVMPGICDQSLCSFDNQKLTLGNLCTLNNNYSYLCKIFPSTLNVSTFCSEQKEHLCNLTKDPKIWDRFSSYNCVIYLYLKYNITNQRDLAYAYRACGSSLPKEWLEPMEFISNLDPKARVISWWDYGHWINYFGNRSAVIRNDHTSLDAIGEVAYAYIMANMSEFDNITKYFGSDYALFDKEILLSDNGFGAKFYALNYLACAWANQTDVKKAQLESQCEKDNGWETIYVTNETCLISPITNKKGNVGYSINIGLTSNQDFSRLKKLYCIGQVKLADGRTIIGTYYLDKKNELGELIVNRALLIPASDSSYNALYTKDKIWLYNNTITDGYEDRKGRFYESPLYRAFILNDLPGWDKVFDNGYVKIYKRKTSS